MNETESQLQRVSRGACCAAVCVVIVVATQCVAVAAPAVTVERETLAMGTHLTIAVRAGDRDRALAASEKAIAAVAASEALLSTWRPHTPLALANAAPPGVVRELTPELAALLARAFAIAGETRGAFDPAVGPLVDAWDLRGAGRVPDAAALHAARGACGQGAWSLDPSRGTLMRRVAGARLEEGAWGKGAALEAAREALGEVPGALLDFGGQLLAVGDGPGGDGWPAQVAHPDDRGRGLLTVVLRDVSLSTSGNSERAVDAGGVRIGHLLDPRRGVPAPDFGSVTVADRDPLRADALSTAFFVMGPEEGLAWADEHGVAAIFLVRGEAGTLDIRSSKAARATLSVREGAKEPVGRGRP